MRLKASRDKYLLGIRVDASTLALKWMALLWCTPALKDLAKHLKVKATGEQIEVGFFGWVARVAHVHQFGRQDRLSKKGQMYKYPERPLLGLSELDRTLIRESLLRHMEKN